MIYREEAESLLSTDRKQEIADIYLEFATTYFKPKDQDEKPDYPEVPPQAAAVSHYGNAETLRIPGTVVMVGIFFVAFVLYYFVNWKYLSEVWPLS